MPVEGVYRFKVLSSLEGNNPGKGVDSFKVTFEVLVSAALDNSAVIPNAVGSSVFMTQSLSGKGMNAGLSRVKAFVVALMGCEEEEMYDEFDPDGLLMAACGNQANAFSAEGNPAIGRIVDCQVTRGRPTPDGLDFFRDFAWAAVPEEEQEVPSPIFAG